MHNVSFLILHHSDDLVLIEHSVYGEKIKAYHLQGHLGICKKVLAEK